MDAQNIYGHRVPQISRNLNPQRNTELENNMGDATEPRKSELVEIPTPTAREIYRVSAIFPFDLTPDTLIIDEAKVSMVYKKFLAQQVNTVLIKDITDVVISTNLLMGALSISGGIYGKDQGPLRIIKLFVSDAMRARRILMGLMIFSDQKVDTSVMAIPEIIQKAEQLGLAK